MNSDSSLACFRVLMPRPDPSSEDTIISTESTSDRAYIHLEAPAEMDDVSLPKSLSQLHWLTAPLMAKLRRTRMLTDIAIVPLRT